MERRVTGSMMERRRRERGDGIGEYKSGHLMGVDICVVRKYVALVKMAMGKSPSGMDSLDPSP
jgi:hypothetical protein